jgi:hypothetical protein
MSALSDDAVALLDVIAAEPNSTLMIGSHVAYSDVCRELLALRKQTALDRQSRAASQVEFARLNLELNEAKETARKLATMYDETSKALGEERSRIGVLLDETASAAIAAGMMDPARRGSLDGPNAIQFLRLIAEQYEAMK